MKRNIISIQSDIATAKEMIVLYARKMANNVEERYDPADEYNVKYWAKKLEQYKHELMG